MSEVSTGLFASFAAFELAGSDDSCENTLEHKSDHSQMPRRQKRCSHFVIHSRNAVYSLPACAHMRTCSAINLVMISIVTISDHTRRLTEYSSGSGGSSGFATAAVTAAAGCAAAAASASTCCCCCAALAGAPSDPTEFCASVTYGQRTLSLCH